MTTNRCLEREENKDRQTQRVREIERRQAENVMCILVSVDQASITKYDKIGLKQ